MSLDAARTSAYATSQHRCRGNLCFGRGRLSGTGTGFARRFLLRHSSNWTWTRIVFVIGIVRRPIRLQMVEFLRENNEAAVEPAS